MAFKSGIGCLYFFIMPYNFFNEPDPVFIQPSLSKSIFFCFLHLTPEIFCSFWFTLLQNEKELDDPGNEAGFTW